MSKIKVSIVEDLDEIRKGFAFLINTSDEFTCIASYSNAEDALADIEANRPDIMIMDIGLPGISGIECTRIIKAQYPAILIMICTVYEDDDRLFKVLSAGASGYILKRTSPSILLDALRDLHNGGSPMSGLIARKVVSFLNGTMAPEQMPVDPINQFNLSKREKELLDLLSAGYRNKEIADKLCISTHTVRTHIYNIYEKLHVQSRVEAINKISSK
jgi:DNA-binding NarL/FixJ family response regulator